MAQACAFRHARKGSTIKGSTISRGHNQPLFFCGKGFRGADLELPDIPQRLTISAIWGKADLLITPADVCE